MAILVLLFRTSVCAPANYAEQDVIHYAKAIDVAVLDRTLSHERLDNWLRAGPPHVDRVSWQASANCDRKPVASDSSYSKLPLCVKLFFERSHVHGWAMIEIGTIGKGPSGLPRLENVMAEPRDAEDPDVGDTYISDMSFKLSELPRLLDEVSYAVEHKQVFQYTKALDVGTLDHTLPSQRFDDWLRSGPAQANELAWRVQFDCNVEQNENKSPATDSPLCVTVVFGQGDIRGWATIVIGTVGKGPSGSPHLKSISVQPMSKGERDRLTSTKLSDLPQFLDKFSALTNHR